jgi:hypothetical protein
VFATCPNTQSSLNLFGTGFQTGNANGYQLIDSANIGIRRVWTFGNIGRGRSDEPLGMSVGAWCRSTEQPVRSIPSRWFDKAGTASSGIWDEEVIAVLYRR